MSAMLVMLSCSALLLLLNASATAALYTKSAASDINSLDEDLHLSYPLCSANVIPTAEELRRMISTEVSKRGFTQEIQILKSVFAWCAKEHLESVRPQSAPRGDGGLIGDVIDFLVDVTAAIESGTVTVVQDLIDAACEFLEQAVALPGEVGAVLVDWLFWVIGILTGLEPQHQQQFPPSSKVAEACHATTTTMTAGTDDGVATEETVDDEITTELPTVTVTTWDDLNKTTTVTFPSHLVY